MWIGPHEYHVIAAVTPAVAQEVGRLAAHRMGGAHGRPLPAESDWPAIRVIDGKTAASARAAWRSPSSTST